MFYDTAALTFHHNFIINILHFLYTKFKCIFTNRIIRIIKFRNLIHTFTCRLFLYFCDCSSVWEQPSWKKTNFKTPKSWINLRFFPPILKYIIELIYVYVLLQLSLPITKHLFVFMNLLDYVLWKLYYNSAVSAKFSN